MKVHLLIKVCLIMFANDSKDSIVSAQLLDAYKLGCMYTSTRTNVVLVCKYVAKVVETIFQAINALEVEDNRSLKQTLTVMNDEFLKGKLFKINKNPD